MAVELSVVAGDYMVRVLAFCTPKGGEWSATAADAAQLDRSAAHEDVLHGQRHCSSRISQGRPTRPRPASMRRESACRRAAAFAARRRAATGGENEPSW